MKILKKNTGFTLIELIIVLSIIIIISTVLYANYPDLSEKQSIDRAVRLISLSIRDAETKAMSIKEDPSSAVAGIFPAYGIYFGTALGAESKKKFILYSDKNKDCDKLSPANCKYDGGINDNIAINRVIPSTAVIKNLCGNIKSSGEVCGLEELSITFLRPNPTIYIKGRAPGLGWQDLNDAEILIDLPPGTKRQQRLVGITQSGQIFLENDSVH